MRFSILASGRVERAVGVAAQAVAVQALARGQGTTQSTRKLWPVAADDHVGVAAALEILADAGKEFVGDPRA